MFDCYAGSGLGSAIRDTRYARQRAQYVNTSIRSTLVSQYALPFRGSYGPDLTQASVSLSQSQEKWFLNKKNQEKKEKLHEVAGDGAARHSGR